MGIDKDEQRQQQGLAEALRASHIGPGELWIRYFGNGGWVGEYEVNAYLQGMVSLPAPQRNQLAEAANDLIDEIPPQPRAPYNEEGQPAGTPSSPREAPS